MEMIRNYVKLPFNIKLIVLSCFTLIILHGIFEIIEFPYIDTMLSSLVRKDKKIKKLVEKLSNILLLALVGIPLSFILSQIENNKLLIYGYISYCMIGSFYIAKFHSNQHLSNYLINRIL